MAYDLTGTGAIREDPILVQNAMDAMNRAYQTSARRGVPVYDAGGNISGEQAYLNTLASLQTAGTREEQLAQRQLEQERVDIAARNASTAERQAQAQQSAASAQTWLTGGIAGASTLYALWPYVQGLLSQGVPLRDAITLAGQGMIGGQVAGQVAGAPLAAETFQLPFQTEAEALYQSGALATPDEAWNYALYGPNIPSAEMWDASAYMPTVDDLAAFDWSQLAPDLLW